MENPPTVLANAIKVGHWFHVSVAPRTPEDGGGYVAVTKLLPGCIGDGTSPAGAVDDLEHLIGAWLREATNLGLPVLPVPPEFTRRLVKTAGV